MARGVLPASQQGILQALVSFPVSVSFLERAEGLYHCRQKVHCTFNLLRPHLANNYSATIFFNYHIQVNCSPIGLFAATISREPGKLLPPIEPSESMVPVIRPKGMSDNQKARLRVFAVLCFYYNSEIDSMNIRG